MPSKRTRSNSKSKAPRKPGEAREELGEKDPNAPEYEFETDEEIEEDGIDCASNDSEGEGMDQDQEDEDEDRPHVFRPGIDEMPEGAELVYDSSAYDMFHKLTVDWPCLSFDIVQDGRGASRVKFPLTCYWACGSQAAEPEENYIGLMKASDMHRTKHDDGEAEDDDEDDDDDDDEGEDADPVLETKKANNGCAVNRVRCMPQRPAVVAAWTEDGHVSCYDFTDHFKQLDNPREWVRENVTSGKAGAPPPLLFRTPTGRDGHATEGFGLDWSPMVANTLASGDCDGQLMVWTVGEGGGIQSTRPTSAKPAPGSIEDIKWSSTQENVLMCALSGGNVQVYDARDPSGAKITWSASPDGVDVNVLDWNRHKQASHLVACGLDDGTFQIWDLRTVAKGRPLQSYNFHQQSITSIEWAPSNESLLAVASDDNQVTIWDFSIVRDREEETAMAARHPELARFPAQLVFQHMGLQNPKELHWHPQLPGTLLVTDANGFDIFRPSNWKSFVR
eukprot:Sspe_Gene.18925::Locus_6844_Transcript_1_1_Confidence_1.000_Length_1820::g.18925::m.18925/K14848/RRB1, GRWD1; ribosome assembly protein RRB1